MEFILIIFFPGGVVELVEKLVARYMYICMCFSMIF